MKIIPAIDIIDGKCVRLTEGDYDTKKIYNEDPLEVAKQFENAGISFLHVVDLDGAKARKIMNASVLERIASNTNLTIDFGGGIQDDNSVQTAIDAGATQITLGSIAAKDRAKTMELVLSFGSERFILGADCRDRKIATSGWTESSELDVADFIRSYQGNNLDEIICTDISKDGKLEGPSIDLYKELIAETNGKIIASGGVQSIEDVQELKQIGCFGAIIGKAIYEQRITLKELSALC